LASAFILGVAGFAAGVVPQACRNGVVICPENAPVPLQAIDVAATTEAPAPAATEAPSQEPAPVPAEEPAVAALEPAVAPLEPTVAPLEPAEPVETAMVERAPASITHNDVVAQTFAALEAVLVGTAGELTSRKVRIVSIDSDGMPVADAEATQVAEAPAAEPIAEPEPAPEPVQVAQAEDPEPVASSEEPPAEAPVAEQAEPAPTAVAYAPVRGGTAVVGRQGGNVRSLPQTKGSDVLFALPRGSDVTVVEMQKGWAKIVDDRGRSGWIWDDLLLRP
jgi:hypothetical protein